VLPAAERGLLDHLVTGPSDDYELLLAVDPAGFEAAATRAAEAGVTFTAIGHFTAEPGLRLASGGVTTPWSARGWDHFASSE
jgi:thiamine monophosphate kinase